MINEESPVVSTGIVDGEVASMFRIIRSILLLIVLMNIGAPVGAADSGWEYKVVLAQASRGVRGLEEQARGVFVDIERTTLLNTLSADGWEFITAIGVPGADHTIYLRRKK